jgi:mersacidin/lichenicidin family type 2 lantibiotic
LKQTINYLKENTMSNIDIIRAWKDPEYRQSLSKAEQAKSPVNPAGLIELKDAELDAVSGGEGCGRETCRKICRYA